LAARKSAADPRMSRIMTQAEPDDQELLAAEYVLGTLDAEERARARALVAPGEEVRAPAAEPPAPEQATFEDRGPQILRLRRRVRRWRKVSLWLFLIAAAGAGLGALRELHPEYLPAELRPTMKTLEITKTAESPPPKP